MATDWVKTTFGKQITLQRGFDITRAEQRDGPIPVVSSGGIASYHDTAAVKGPGVIIGRKGVVGSAFYVEKDYWPHDTTLWVKDFHGNEPRFAYYFLLSLVATLKRLDVGSANPTLNRNHVHPLEIEWPPLHEQRAIASVLGALDDKIELNLKMSETLEAMARALFVSWFVDFDPVRAKVERRKTDQTTEIEALFPDSFAQSNDGPIPDGWSRRGLDEIASFLNGLALQRFPPLEGAPTLPVIKIAQLRGGSVVGADRANTGLKADYVIENGDILFSWSGSLECQIWTGGRGALNQHLFKVRGTLVPDWFIYLAVRHHLPDFRQIAADKATTMGHIQRHHLHDAKIAIPPKSLVAKATSVFEPIIEASWKRRLESSTLAAIRDALLPKLISGEIRVAVGER